MSEAYPDFTTFELVSHEEQELLTLYGIIWS